MNKEKYMKNGIFSLEYDKETLKDMVLDLQEKLDKIKFYIEQSNIKDMLWGKEILKIIGGNDEQI